MRQVYQHNNPLKRKSIKTKIFRSLGEKKIIFRTYEHFHFATLNHSKKKTMRITEHTLIIAKKKLQTFDFTSNCKLFDRMNVSALYCFESE